MTPLTKVGARGTWGICSRRMIYCNQAHVTPYSSAGQEEGGQVLVGLGRLRSSRRGREEQTLWARTGASLGLREGRLAEVAASASIDSTAADSGRARMSSASPE